MGKSIKRRTKKRSQLRKLQIKMRLLDKEKRKKKIKNISFFCLKSFPDICFHKEKKHKNIVGSVKTTSLD